MTAPAPDLKFPADGKQQKDAKMQYDCKNAIFFGAIAFPVRAFLYLDTLELTESMD